jgi:hypothetical protein
VGDQRCRERAVIAVAVFCELVGLGGVDDQQAGPRLGQRDEAERHRARWIEPNDLRRERIFAAGVENDDLNALAPWTVFSSSP